jgi:hypothetical protein
VLFGSCVGPFSPRVKSYLTMYVSFTIGLLRSGVLGCTLSCSGRKLH